MADQGDGMPDTDVAEAVAQAVARAGPQLFEEPRRVQGMLNDVLGAESRTRRAEVDAVVVAAEESVPDDLISGRIHVDEALGRLRARGLDAGMALFAVDVWRYALGMLDATSQPPSPRKTWSVMPEPTIADPMPPQTVLASTIDAAPRTAVAGTESETTRLRVPLLIGAAAAVLGLLVIGLVVLATGDDNDETIAATAASIGEPSVQETAVEVTLSAPPPSVQIPSEIFIIGSTEVEVRTLLEAPPFEFTVKSNMRSSPTVPAGTVMAIRPVPDEMVTRGSDVVIIVSEGPEPVRVPAVVGRTEAEAVDVLHEAGLTPGVTYVEVDQLSPDAGRVIAQDLPRGAQVEPGTGISVAVGRAVVAFPDLSGQTYRQALETLAAAGFIENSLLGTEEGTFVNATINGRDISPGDRFPRGTGIDLLFL